MKILIKEGSRTITIPIPGFLLGGRLGSKALDKYTRKASLSGNPGDLKKILAQAEKQYPGWVLVEVESSDGEEVKIVL